MSGQPLATATARIAAWVLGHPAWLPALLGGVAGIWALGFLFGYVLGVGQARAAVRALQPNPVTMGTPMPLPSLLGGLTGWWALTRAILAERRSGASTVRRQSGRCRPRSCGRWPWVPGGGLDLVSAAE
ncbi:MAG: hypothetical protein OWV35_02430 [Firmicutes bacterium]|nr:hypothetical protein [Bacillota bacterium]